MTDSSHPKGPSTSITRVPRANSLAAALPPTQRVLDAFFRGLSKRSVAAYKEALLQFAAWASAEELLELHDDREVTLSNVSALVFAWDSLTAHSEVLRYLEWMKAKGLSPSTINHRMSALRSLFRLGRQLGLIAWGLDVKGVKPGLVRDVRGPAVSDVKKLLAHARAKGTRPYAMLLLMFERGLRGLEVRELKLQHLRLSGSPPIILVRGKGQTGLSPLTVSRECRDALLRWLEVRATCGHAEAEDPASYVFFKQGHPLVELSRAALWAVVKGLGDECGVKVWPHALRHSAITAALDATNGDIRRVQKFSRHAKVDTVLRYDDDRRDVGGELSEMLSKSVK